jgi:hypothetical protein
MNKTTEIDTLEYHQTEKIETEVKDVDRILRIEVYAALSRVSFWGIPFTQYHICTIPPLPTAPPQKRKLPDRQFCTGQPGSSYTALKVFSNSVLG